MAGISVHKSEQKYQQAFEYYLFLVAQHLLWSKLQLCIFPYLFILIRKDRFQSFWCLSAPQVIRVNWRLLIGVFRADGHCVHLQQLSKYPCSRHELCFFFVIKHIQVSKPVCLSAVLILPSLGT